MLEIEKTIDEKAKNNKVNEIASKINELYKNQELYIIWILKGSFLFTSDIIKQLTIPIYLDFMIVSSYKDNIITGYTLKKVVYHINKRNPKSISLCTLFNKTSRREVNVDVNFVGFNISNEFIVGYGLDYAEKYRNLPYVGKLKKKIK